MPSEAKPKQKIDMRKSKLKASEAAMLAGELNKPTWESKNEGIHERVSFEDAIWGFDLAGGSFYKTPLRVTAVKDGSRAEKAGIRPGDMLLRINDIETSTLTIQEAHEIIIESGIHLRIAVTAPDDEEDSYHCWEDPLQSGYDSDEERRKEAERVKKREVHAKVSSYWSLQWPWVSKRRVIYRESNCFLVPSKFEAKNRDKFPLETNFGPKVLDDIVLNSASAEKGQQLQDEMNQGEAFGKTNTVEESNKAKDSEVSTVAGVNNVVEENLTNKVNSELKSDPSPKENGSENKTDNDTKEDKATTKSTQNNQNVPDVNKEDNVDNIDKENTEESTPTKNLNVNDSRNPEPASKTDYQEASEEANIENGIDVHNDVSKEDVVDVDDIDVHNTEESDSQIKNPIENDPNEPDITSESEVSDLQEASEETVIDNGAESDANISNSDEVTLQDDEILDELLGKSTEIVKEDEETIFNDILNESDAQTSEVINENQR